MGTTNYDEISEMGKDIIKEIGNIGMGSAATAISQILNTQVRIALPSVELLDFNESIRYVGDAEEAVMAVMAEMVGEIQGVVLFLFRKNFANALIKEMLGAEIENYELIDDMSFSALTEVGNIVISSYANALAGLIDLDIKLSVPTGTMNMLGGILNVPMVEVGYEADKLLMVKGEFYIQDKLHEDCLLMIPSVKSLDTILKRLGC